MDGSSEQLPSPSIAPAPFDREDADLILRSSDGVDFRVFKGVFFAASPRLTTRIRSLDNSNSGQPLALPLPIMSRVLETLLRLIYPVERSGGQDQIAFNDMGLLIAASVDLDLAAATAVLKKKLKDRFLPNNPTACYALAVKYEWIEIAQKAAKHARAKHEGVDSPMLDDVPASAYVALKHYIEDENQSSLDWPSSHRVPPSNGVDDASSMNVDDEYRRTLFDGESHVSDLIFRSSDGVEFHVLKAIMSISSEFFRDMLSLPQAQGTVDAQSVIPVEEDARTLATFLCFLYPVQEPEISDLAEARSLLRAAIKYDAKRIISRAKDIIAQKFVNDSPLSVYCIASLPEFSGMEDLATLAARAVLRRRFEDLKATELDEIPASTYRQLERYVRQCRTDVKQVLDSGSLPGWWHWHTEAARAHSCLRTRLLAWHTPVLVPAWFISYLNVARDALRERPGDVDAVMAPSPRTVAGTCEGCARSKGPEGFNEDLAKQIRSKIEAVVL